MSFKVTVLPSNVVQIDYSTSSLFAHEGNIKSSFGIYARDISDLIKALEDAGFKQDKESEKNGI